jgi:8-oxo-dGTP diphosphatase
MMTGEVEEQPHREYPKSPLVGVGAVVIKEAKILLVKRAVPPGIGKWSIPGGLVEIGETLSQACVRETEEETGLKIEVLELINVFDMIDRDEDARTRYHYVLIGFLAKPVGGTEKMSGECTDMKWVPHTEAKAMDLTRTAQRALDELFGASLA